MRMDIAMELEGEFLWDVEARHLSSYKLDGDMSADMTITQTVDIQGDPQDLVVKVELGGQCAVEGRFTTP